jgi:FAD/FMN-containing dehydrogenase
MMINISKAVASWPTDSWGWSISPGVKWCKAGARIIVMGNQATLGDGAIIGERATWAIDIGAANGYRVCVAEVNGVAYVGAGCRWFTLSAALKHMQDDDRIELRCLLESAIAIAGYRGLGFGDEH